MSTQYHVPTHNALFALVFQGAIFKWQSVLDSQQSKDERAALLKSALADPLAAEKLISDHRLKSILAQGPAHFQNLPPSQVTPVLINALVQAIYHAYQMFVALSLLDSHQGTGWDDLAITGQNKDAYIGEQIYRLAAAFSQTRQGSLACWPYTTEPLAQCANQVDAETL